MEWLHLQVTRGRGRLPALAVDVAIGGRFKSRLPINYKLPVVFGLVVNFGD